jgi:hydroxyacylglutathione hydrolase
MLLKRFYDETLAQASYLVGCQSTGEALVIDPNRDVDVYIEAVEREQLRLTHVTETHIHADFVSGARELAARTGAQLLLSDEGGDDWRYRFAARDRATLLRDGDSFKVGNIRIEVLHTPGHTPEHISLLLTDGAASDRPMGIFTGDFVFVGDVGRPDLLERAAHVQGTMASSARTLFQSLQRVRALPDYLQIWPGHGAGSACGKALGAVPSTTLGYEKLVNWAFSIDDQEEFVRQVLAGQPEPPRYFAEMKRINRDGPLVRERIENPRRVPSSAVFAALEEGAPVIDLRAAVVHADGFVPGTVNIPLNRSFTNWAGSLLPYDRDVMLVADDENVAREAMRLMALIGLDRVAGWVGPELLDDWLRGGHSLGTIPEIEPSELAGRGDAVVLDVRNASEWEGGRIPGARHRFLGSLMEQLHGLERDTPIVVQCQTGSRSAIAASLLRAAGFTDVTNLRGGLVSWQAAGLPIETEDRAEVAN